MWVFWCLSPLASTPPLSSTLFFLFIHHAVFHSKDIAWSTLLILQWWACRLFPIICGYKQGCGDWACYNIFHSSDAKRISWCQVELLQVSTGICFCDFDKFCQIALQRSCSNLHVHQQCLKELVSAHSCQCRVTKLSIFCQCGGWRIAHWSFDF